MAATSSLSLSLSPVSPNRPGQWATRTAQFEEEDANLWLRQSQPQKPPWNSINDSTCHPTWVLMYYTAIHSRGDAYSLGFLPPPKHWPPVSNPAGNLTNSGGMGVPEYSFGTRAIWAMYAPITNTIVRSNNLIINLPVACMPPKFRALISRQPWLDLGKTPGGNYLASFDYWWICDVV